MYYPQNTQSITTVILSFDGVMTDLSKLRYNYYRRFCKLYNATLDTESYFNKCDSQSTMYENSPIPANLIQPEALKTKVEEDLYAYSKNHGIKIHQGFDELHTLIKSKKIKLVYTSTHPKKWTEQLFALTGSLYRPNQFAYDDFSIYEQYKDNPSQVLVIASDLPTLKLANRYRYNVLYYPTLQEENIEIKVRSMAVIYHLIEAINLILDPYRQPKHQYVFMEDGKISDDKYHTLLDQNPSIASIITKIYNEEKMNVIEKIEENVKEELIENFEEKSEQIIEELETKDETMSEDIKEGTLDIHLPYIEASEDLFEKTMVFDFKLTEKEAKENPLDTIELDNSFTLDPLEEINEDTHTDIDAIINELNENKNNHAQIFTKAELKEFGMSEDDLYNEDIDDDDDDTSIFKKIFGSLLYAIVDSIIFMMIYLAMSIGLYDWIYKPNSLLSFLQPFLKVIYSISMTSFGAIASLIASPLNASATLIEGIAVFLFITSILWISLFLSSLLKKHKSKD